MSGDDQDATGDLSLDGSGPGDQRPEQGSDDAAIAALERAREGARGRRPGRARRDRAGGPRPAQRPSNEPFSPGRDPQPVASSLDRLLRDRGWTKPLSVAGVVARWRDVVGDQLADHCHPETFEDGALVVRADSSAWAMQVRLLLPQLQRRLEEEVGEGVVDTVTVLGPGGPSWKRGPRSVPGRGPRDTYG